MLEDTYRGEISSEAPQKCKPDYEELITQAKSRLGANLKFQDAIYEYTGYRQLRGKMAELLGELASEERALNIRIENLVHEQEQDND